MPVTLTKQQKIIRACGWIYQSCNPDPKVKKALRIIRHPDQAEAITVHGLDSTKAKVWWSKRVLWDDDTNLVKQYRTANHYRYSKAHELLNFLFTHVRVAPNVPLFLYDGLITFKNCKLYHDPNGKPIILTPKGHDVVKMLEAVEARMKQYLKGDYDGRSKGQARIARNIMMFINSIEIGIFKALRKRRNDFFNGHEHTLLASWQDFNIKAWDDHNRPKYSVWHKVMNYINKYFDNEITVTVRPLVNKFNGHSIIIDKNTSDTDWSSVFYATLYYLKQRTLPMPKSWKDYYTLRDYPNKSKLAEVVQAVLNSIPKSARLRKVLNFKLRERKLNSVLMGIIAQVLKLSNTISLWGGQSNFFLFLFIVTSYLNFRTNKDKPPPDESPPLLFNIRNKKYSREVLIIRYSIKLLLNQ